jgi:uncharacterized protein (DUF305 family)
LAGYVKPFHTTWRKVLVVLTLAGLTTACTINVNLPGTASQENSPAGSSRVFSHQDLMFAEMMIPHHEQAVEMSDLALQISTSNEVRDLATRIKAGQVPEIDQMQAWLDVSGGAGMHHGGQGGMMDSMGGMATEAELVELASLVSPDFDRTFLQLMIEHHEGALDMVQMISNSTNDEVAALADDIVAVQSAEISEMRELLSRL